MSALREAAQQALEALEQFGLDNPHRSYELEHAVIAALKAALAQQADPTDPGRDVDVLREHVRHLERRVRQLHAQQAEPAQAISECIAVLRPMVKGKFPHEQALDELVGYTAPPQRTMVSLTEGEISAMAQKTWKPSVYYDAFSLLGTDNLVALVRAVEQASWEKNHGQA